MQYQVPQFIEIEDKIFGPLTFKQFAYLAGGGAMCYIAYRFLPFIIAVIFIVPVGGLSLALAFYKVNKRPFIDVMESAIHFALGSKLYLWKKEEKKQTPNESPEEAVGSFVSLPRLSESKLKDLTWSLDVHESIYSKEGGGLRSREALRPQKAEDDQLQSFRGFADDMKRR